MVSATVGIRFPAASVTAAATRYWTSDRVAQAASSGTSPNNSLPPNSWAAASHAAGEQRRPG